MQAIQALNHFGAATQRVANLLKCQHILIGESSESDAAISIALASVIKEMHLQ